MPSIWSMLILTQFYAFNIIVIDFSGRVQSSFVFNHTYTGECSLHYVSVCFMLLFCLFISHICDGFYIMIAKRESSMCVCVCVQYIAYIGHQLWFALKKKFSLLYSVAPQILFLYFFFHHISICIAIIIISSVFELYVYSTQSLSFI